MLALRVTVLTGAAVAVGLMTDLVTGQAFDAAATLREVVTNPLYLLAVVALGAGHLRLILHRMGGKTRTLLNGAPPPGGLYSCHTSRPGGTCDQDHHCSV